MAQSQYAYYPPTTKTVAAAGSLQSDATPVVGGFNTVTGADSAKGVILQTPLYGDPSSGYSGIKPVVIYNSDSSGVLLVYPQSGGSIDGGSANASISLVAGQISVLYPLSATAWRQATGAAPAALTSVSAGTVTASKAVVVDSNKDVAQFRNVGLTNLDCGLTTGTAGSVDIFPGTTTTGKVSIVAAANGGNFTVTVTNASFGQACTLTIPDAGSSTDTFLTAKANNAISGTLTQTSTSAVAYTVGRQGATNPALKVNANAGTSVTGVEVIARATGSAGSLAAIGSATDVPVTLDGKGAGKTILGGTSTGLTVLGRGSVNVPITSSTKVSLSSQNVAPTAAQLLGGYVLHVSATGAGTFTLDNGTNIDTAIGADAATGDSFEVHMQNTGNQTSTITTNTGLSLKGTAAISAGKAALIKFIKTGSGTYDVSIIAGA